VKYSLPAPDERLHPTLRKYADGQISAYDAACEIQDMRIPGYDDPSASEVILWAVAVGYGIPAPSEEEAREEATRILEKIGRKPS
jgi:hypothetical protein